MPEKSVTDSKPLLNTRGGDFAACAGAGVPPWLTASTTATTTAPSPTEKTRALSWDDGSRGEEFCEL